MSDVNCPYCNAGVEICHDDGYGYEEDGLFEQSCPQCEKNFAFTTTIIFHYYARKADCLNEGEHNYEKTKTYSPEFARLRCGQCGDEIPLSTEHRDEVKA